VNLKPYLEGFSEFMSLVRGLSPNTIQEYKKEVERFLAFARGKASQQRFSPQDILEYLTRVSQEGSNSPVTRNKKLSALKAFFSYLVAVEVIELKDDPAKNIPLARKRPFEKLPRILSKEEVLKLLKQPNRNTIKGRRDYAILILLYLAGLRISEVCTIRLKDINWDEGIIFISGKGSRQRVIPLEAEIKEVLQEYLKVREETGDNLFLNKREEPLTPRGIQKMLKKYAQQANIKGRITPHNLRHSCGTELYRATGDIVKVAKYLGHASTYTTARVYVTLATEDLAKIAQNHPIYELLKELKPANEEREA
jgi:site-specific recombinase XerD